MGVITRIVLYCDKGCGRTFEDVDDAPRKQMEASARKAGWSCTEVGHVCPECVEAAKGVLHVAEIRVTFHPEDSGTYPSGMTYHTPAGHTYAFFQNGRKRVGGTCSNPDTEAAWQYIYRIAARMGYTHFVPFGTGDAPKPIPAPAVAPTKEGRP